MEEALVIAVTFLGLSSIVAIPLAVLLGIPALTMLGSRWIKLQEKELELRRTEVALKIRESSLLPQYVDATNTHAVLEWARADAEVRALRAD